MYMKHLITILTIFYSGLSFGAKFHPVSITMTDGKDIEGYAVNPPSPRSQKITFRKTQYGEKIKLNSDDISTIVFHYNDGDVTLEWLATSGYFSPEENAKRMIFAKSWLRLYEKKYLSVYVRTAAGYIGLGGASSFPNETIIYLRKPDENEATIIHREISGIQVVAKNAIFKRTGLIYFKDCPEIISKIKSDTYTYETLEEVITQYEKCMTSQ